MKDIEFLGDSLDRLRAFPAPARSRIGYELDRVQHGLAPTDFKPLPTVGAGVQEIRVWDRASGTYRVVYTARFADAVYVLHVFQKKTQKTAQRDLDLARRRYRDIAGAD